MGAADRKSQDYGADLNTLTEAHKCLRKLSYFTKVFWDVVIPTPLVWNWHMDVLCDEIQAISERVFRRELKEYDLVINVPPGMSKTLITAVMAVCYDFARNPSTREALLSYSDMAVSGMSDYIKLIMQSEKYKLYFPNTIIRHDKNNIHNFKTTLNGEFYATTIGGTLTSKHFDILRCLPYDEILITPEGEMKIGDIVENKIQTSVLSYNHKTNVAEFKPIIKHEKNDFRQMVEIETHGGKKLKCTWDHLVYVEKKGYIKAINLEENDTIITY